MTRSLPHTMHKAVKGSPQTDRWTNSSMNRAGAGRQILGTRATGEAGKGLPKAAMLSRNLSVVDAGSLWKAPSSRGRPKPARGSRAQEGKDPTPCAQPSSATGNCASPGAVLGQLLQVPRMHSLERRSDSILLCAGGSEARGKRLTHKPVMGQGQSASPAAL